MLIKYHVMKLLGSKKIYETMEEIINPEHTMLVMWDVQNGLVNNVFNKNEFLSSAKRLLEAARASGMKVLYTKITPLPKEYMSPAMISSYMMRFHVDDPEKLPVFMAPGSSEAEIYDELRPKENDYVLNKHTASIFIGTIFDNMLKAAKIETIIFAGIATEIGVESSARDAGNLGYYTIVASDACSSSSRDGHEAALKSLSSVVMVSTVDDIIKNLKY